MNAEPFVIERVLDAPVKKVWAAITDKAQMKIWYFDLEKFEPKVGFEFSFIGCSSGEQYKHKCRVTQVIEFRKIAYTWAYEGYEGESEVTFELSAEGSRTKLKLTHTGLETFPTKNPDFAKTNFVAGWTDLIGKMLVEFVEE